MVVPYGFFGCVYHRPQAAHDQSPMPLLGVHAEGTIYDFTAQVVLSQRYKNTETDPVEIEYLFPLDDIGAVCGFEAEINGKKVIGKVMDKDKAANTYDDAIASGGGAYMLKQDKPDVASLSIGNLPPNAECVIKITYVTELVPEEERVRFVLPATISPQTKVDPSYQQMTPSPSPNQQLTGFSIDFKLNMASNIKSISSPTHPLDLEFEGRTARVRLGKQTTITDGDLELLIGVAEPFTPRLWVEPVTNNGTLEGYSSMAVFYPSFEIIRLVTPYPKAEFIFVIDQSGSMSGQQIADAKAALHILLRSIPEGSKFNIVGFGSQFSVMSQESVEYNAKSFEAAKVLIDSMNADKGGTNLKDPLTWVFRQRADFNYPRQVFVLTDGQIEDTNAVLEMTKLCSGVAVNPKVKDAFSIGKCSYYTTKNVFAPQHWYQCRTCNMVETLGLCGMCKNTCHSGHDVIGPYFSDFFCDCAESTTHPCKALNIPSQLTKDLYKSSTRVFSLGIGSGVDRNLVVGLARAGNGTSVFVKTGEKMEKKVVGQLKVSLQPALNDISLDWSVKTVQSPAVPPPIFNKSRLIVYSTSSEKPTKVTLKALADCNETITAEVLVEQASNSDLVKKLAAKARIRDLEEINASANKQEITNVSLKNSVLSTFTAFIAVEKRQDSTEGTMISRKYVAPAAFSVTSYKNAPTFSLCSAPAMPLAACPPAAFSPQMNPSPSFTFAASSVSSAPKPLAYSSASSGTVKFFSSSPFSASSSLFGSTNSASGLQPQLHQQQQFHQQQLHQQPSFQPQSKPLQTPDQSLQALMNLQLFNGAWELTQALGNIIKIAPNVMQSAKPPNATDQQWATAIALAYLEVKLKMLIAAWEMAAQKSKSLLNGAGLGGLIDTAKQFVQANCK